MTTSARDYLGMIRAARRRWERSARAYDVDQNTHTERCMVEAGAELRRREDALLAADEAAGRPSSAHVQPTVSERMKAAAWWAKVRKQTEVR